MAYAGIQQTVNLYSMREAQLTNEMGDIMNDITLATRDMSELSKGTATARQSVAADYEPDSAEYKAAIAEIQDEYELNLAQINAWESELECRKEQIETEIQATSSYKESFTSMLKENIQKSYTYGGGGQ